MSLPLHTRAAALVAALSTAAAVLVTVAEMGHPPPDGQGLVAQLVVLPLMGTAWADPPAEPQTVTKVAARVPQP